MVKILRRVSVLALLAVASVTAFPALSSANHSWGNYHWARTTNPFTLMLGDNVWSVWDEYLGTASGDWSKSLVLDTSIVAGRTDPKKCRPTRGRVEVCAARYGFNGWLGLAQIWVSGSHITQAIVKLNDTYFNTTKYNTPPWRSLVMCQEIGHTFGLDHQDENFNNANLGTCMDYTNDPDGPPSNEHPDSHDYDQLQTIYSHLDSISTVGTAALASGKRLGLLPVSDTDDEPEVGTAQWGRLVRSTNRGRTEVYELDLGRGHKVFTFVIWAEGDVDGGNGGPVPGGR